MNDRACDECLAALGEALEMVTRNAGDPGPLLASVEAVCLAEPAVGALVGRIVGTHQRNVGELAASKETLTTARQEAIEADYIDLADEIAITLAGVHVGRRGSESRQRYRRRGSPSARRRDRPEGQGAAGRICVVLR